MQRVEGTASCRGPGDRAYSLPTGFQSDIALSSPNEQLIKHLSLPLDHQPCSAFIRDEQNRRKSMATALPELSSTTLDNNFIRIAAALDCEASTKGEIEVMLDINASIQCKYPSQPN